MPFHTQREIEQHAISLGACFVGRSYNYRKDFSHEVSSIAYFDSQGLEVFGYSPDMCINGMYYGHWDEKDGKRKWSISDKIKHIEKKTLIHDATVGKIVIEPINR